MTAYSEQYQRVCGRPREELCKHGHDLSVTRTITPGGTYGCSACSRASVARSYQKRDPEAKKRSSRNTKLKRNYGITIEDYDRMFAAQGGVCKICGNHQRYQKLAVDHDHKTGKVRGLLCVHCNRALGHMFDSPLRLIRAAEYLRNATATTQISEDRQSRASTRRQNASVSSA